MKKILLAISFVWGAAVCHAQNDVPVETETHIFWQADRPLTAADFQGDGSANPRTAELSEKYDMNAVGFIGLWSVLDIPKRKKWRGLEEKIYFVPAFQKETSYILKGNTDEIIYEQMLFDIFELSARMAKKSLDEYRKEAVEGTGMQAIMFKTVEQEVIEYRDEMVASFVRDVRIDKREGAWQEWREQIDGRLHDLEEYATTPDDRLRFINGAPLDSRYKKAEHILGPMQKRSPASDSLP
jgi:hypothetical protein